MRKEKEMKEVKEKKKNVYLVSTEDPSKKRLVNAKNRRSAMEHIRGKDVKFTISKPTILEIVDFTKQGIELEEVL